MMYCCKCLNVTINTLNSDIEQIDLHSLMLSDAEKNDHFFKQNILKVSLKSVQKAQEYLLHIRTLGEWLIYQCWNCGLHTHAVRANKNTSVFISSNLIVNTEEIAILRKSNQYSAAFRIVINHSDANMAPEKMSELISIKRKIEAGDLALGGLHQQLTELIKMETQATEEKVKQYTEQQYSQLDSFKERVRQEHRALVKNILIHQASSNLTHCKTDNIERLETPPSNVDMFESTLNESPLISRSDVENKHKFVKSQFNQSSLTQTKSTTASRKTHSKFSNSIRGESYDSEALFDLEGMDDNTPSNRTHSDIESDTCITDTDDSQDEINTIRQRPAYSTSLAKSLPINVPAFMSPYHHNGVDIDDDQAPEYPLDIAASIKALAKSVHGDAVFGDLPKPRFSTQI